MFSQTGGEIVELSNRLGRAPNLVITNKQDFSNVNDELLSSKFDIIQLPAKPSIDQYNIALQNVDPNNTLITLHGYLRILPSIICDEFNVINGHPGLITKYPELKGFNPQERAINHDTIGCVLHRVIAEVDEGEIIASHEIKNTWRHKDGVIAALKEVQINLWEKYLKENL